MTTNGTITDPRPHYRTAVTWVAGLAAAVREDQLGNPTPCDGFDVRALLGHLVTTVRKPTLTGRGADAAGVPHVVTDYADGDLAHGYAAEADAACAAWTDDATLEALVPMPWGEAPGHVALGAYLNEALVHGWELAVATGQDPEADPAVVAVGQGIAERILPAQGREYFPFDPPVEPAADAGPTERLANWAGRRTAPWRSTSDPRPLHRDAIAWVSHLAAGVRPEQMGNPTPCDEFDVRSLLAHLVSVQRKLRATAEGTDITAVPHVTPGIADDELAREYTLRARAMLDAWSDDALLDAPVRVPWGEVAGREALEGYLNEVLVHGWDLAVATGQDPEADPALVAHASGAIVRLVPAGDRAGSRFGDAVEPAPDAGPTERLANWSGHHRTSM